VGHTHSSDPSIARLREFTTSGELGRLAMVSMLNYTDFLYRPRRPEELDTAQGGGIAYNQLPHQVEVARMVAASPVRSVRAAMWRLDAGRPTEGCSSAFMAFESGTVATMVYSGYDHFDSDELHSWISSSGRPKVPAHGSARRALRALSGPAEELRLRAERYGYGGSRGSGTPTHQPHFGQVILTYERADVRLSPKGLMVYGDDGVRELAIDPVRNGRTELLDEFCACILDGRPPVHDGAFARATLQACLAMLHSSETRREVAL
jgi:phthalate 4,5-cis-dihydrodiol dehydrogenase